MPRNSSSSVFAREWYRRTSGLARTLQVAGDSDPACRVATLLCLRHRRSGHPRLATRRWWRWTWKPTGLDPAHHGIVSIGLIPFDSRRIRARQSRYWVVRPRRTLDSESITIHHLTHDQVEQAPDLEDILPELLSELSGRIVVVHYRNIERPFLLRAVAERLGEGLIFPLIDTMQIESATASSQTSGLAWIDQAIAAAKTSGIAAPGSQPGALPSAALPGASCPG